jgi:hypothetical protein
MLCGDPRRNGSINGSGIGSGIGIPSHWTRRAVWRRSRPATASRATRIKLRGALAKTKNPRRITSNAAPSIDAITKQIAAKWTRTPPRLYLGGVLLGPAVSFPKIISARSDDAIRTELAWQ